MTHSVLITSRILTGVCCDYVRVIQMESFLLKSLKSVQWHRVPNSARDNSYSKRELYKIEAKQKQLEFVHCFADFVFQAIPSDHKSLTQSNIPTLIFLTWFYNNFEVSSINEKYKTSISTILRTYCKKNIFVKGETFSRRMPILVPFS